MTNKVLALSFSNSNVVLSLYDGSFKILFKQEREVLQEEILKANSPNLILSNSLNINPNSHLPLLFQFREESISQNTYNYKLIILLILRKIKDFITENFKEEIPDLVIAVPIFFTKSERVLLFEIAKNTGLQVRAFLNECTAASISYSNNVDLSGIFLVYHLDSNYFSISVYENLNFLSKILVYKVNTNINGFNFKSLLKNNVENFFKKEFPDLNLKHPFLRGQLLDQIEKVEKDLLELDETFLNLFFFDEKYYNCKITRENFNALINNFIEKSIFLTLNSLEKVSIKGENVKNIIFSGFYSHLPVVNDKLRDHFLNANFLNYINSEELVAMGTAIYANNLRLEERASSDNSLLYSIGIELKNDKFFPIIKRNTTLPTKVKKAFTTVNTFQREVEINILQGESEKASNNYYLAKVRFKNLLNSKDKSNKIELIFELNREALLIITAKNLESGREEREELKISPFNLNENHGLSFFTNLYNLEKNKNEFNEILDNNIDIASIELKSIQDIIEEDTEELFNEIGTYE